MITIINAWTGRGWGSRDHLIDDSRLAEIIGRSFATVEHARRAARARAPWPQEFEFVNAAVPEKLFKYGHIENARFGVREI